MGKRILFSLMLLICVSLSFAATTILSEPSVCCERTDSGQWCVNAESTSCDSDYRSAPAACASTSFCQLGTCYDSGEGICFENTPQRVCEDSGGTWDERELQEVPQCQLGCCLIGDEASFVPLVRCKKLSTYYGVSMDYRTDVTSEAACISLANSADMGACVYEQDFERVCDFTSRGACGAEESVESIFSANSSASIGSSGRKFYEGLLCSAEELNTVCAKQASTGCFQGDAYYFDSCGNRENVVSGDAEKSWANGRSVEADGICSPNDGSDPDCGNCDYLLGSRCETVTGILSGDNAYCQRTTCTDRWGEERKNGESWCVNDGMSGDAQDKVGSRYFREICVDGEVQEEPCADFRNEVCFESSLETSAGDFSVAACRVNRWQDCIAVTDKGTCLNNDRRDCTWLSSPVGLLIGGASAGSSSGADSTFSNPTVGNTGQSAFGNPTAPVTGNALFGGDDSRSENETTTSNRDLGVCVPRYSPGLQFWDSGSAQSICATVSGRCVVKYSKSALGDYECVENCDCLSEDWAVDMNRVCSAVGDCGAYVNYEGAFTDSGYEWHSGSDTLSFTAEGEQVIRSGQTGNVVLDYLRGGDE